jgi:hypothetical protein
MAVSVRRRSWIAPNGARKEAWIVDYRDQHGGRHIKTFARRKDADAEHAQVQVAIRAGIHTADRASITVAEAGRLWIGTSTNAGLERATLEYYEQHLKFHIVPLLGAKKLSQLTVPAVREFEDRLAKDRSPIMVRKVLRSLGSILTDAQERGLIAQNVVHNLRRNRRQDRTARTDRRQRGKLKAGIDIPTPAEIAAGTLCGQAVWPIWRFS